jgi:hypothetical protein
MARNFLLRDPAMVSSCSGLFLKISITGGKEETEEGKKTRHGVDRREDGDEKKTEKTGGKEGKMGWRESREEGGGGKEEIRGRGREKGEDRGGEGKKGRQGVRKS